MSAAASGNGASAASTDAEILGPMKRAAIACVKFDVHEGKHKPRLLVETVVPDPQNRDGIYASEDDICQCGDDVAAAGFSDLYTSGKCVRLPRSPAAREHLFELIMKKSTLSQSHPPGFS